MARIVQGTGNVRLEGIATPTSNNDAATKAYVDANAGSGGSGGLPSFLTVADGTERLAVTQLMIRDGGIIRQGDRTNDFFLVSYDTNSETDVDLTRYSFGLYVDVALTGNSDADGYPNGTSFEPGAILDYGRTANQEGVYLVTSLFVLANDNSPTPSTANAVRIDSSGQGIQLWSATTGYSTGSITLDNQSFELYRALVDIPGIISPPTVLNGITNVQTAIALGTGATFWRITFNEDQTIDTAATYRITINGLFDFTFPGSLINSVSGVTGTARDWFIPAATVTYTEGAAPTTVVSFEVGQTTVTEGTADVNDRPDLDEARWQAIARNDIRDPIRYAPHNGESVHWTTPNTDAVREARITQTSFSTITPTNVVQVGSTTAITVTGLPIVMAQGLRTNGLALVHAEPSVGYTIFDTSATTETQADAGTINAVAITRITDEGQVILTAADVTSLIASFQDQEFSVSSLEEVVVTYPNGGVLIDTGSPTSYTFNTVSNPGLRASDITISSNGPAFLTAIGSVDSSVGFKTTHDINVTRTRNGTPTQVLLFPAGTDVGNISGAGQFRVFFTSSAADAAFRGSFESGDVVQLETSGLASVIDVGDGPITATEPVNGTTTLGLADTTVSAGDYINADITVDAQGRITAATSGNVQGVTTEQAARIARPKFFTVESQLDYDGLRNMIIGDVVYVTALQEFFVITDTDNNNGAPTSESTLPITELRVLSTIPLPITTGDLVVNGVDVYVATANNASVTATTFDPSSGYISLTAAGTVVDPFRSDDLPTTPGNYELNLSRPTVLSEAPYAIETINSAIAGTVTFLRGSTIVSDPTAIALNEAIIVRITDEDSLGGDRSTALASVAEDFLITITTNSNSGFIRGVVTSNTASTDRRDILITITEVSNLANTSGSHVTIEGLDAYDWVSAASELSDLTDVDFTTAPVTNDILGFDGTNWTPTLPPGHTSGTGVSVFPDWSPTSAYAIGDQVLNQHNRQFYETTATISAATPAGVVTQHTGLNELYIVDDVGTDFIRLIFTTEQTLNRGDIWTINGVTNTYNIHFNYTFNAEDAVNIAGTNTEYLPTGTDTATTAEFYIERDGGGRTFTPETVTTATVPPVGTATAPNSNITDLSNYNTNTVIERVQFAGHIRSYNFNTAGDLLINFASTSAPNPLTYHETVFRFRTAGDVPVQSYFFTSEGVIRTGGNTEDFVWTIPRESLLQTTTNIQIGQGPLVPSSASVHSATTASVVNLAPNFDPNRWAELSPDTTDRGVTGAHNVFVINQNSELTNVFGAIVDDVIYDRGGNIWHRVTRVDGDGTVGLTLPFSPGEPLSLTSTPTFAFRGQIIRQGSGIYYCTDSPTNLVDINTDLLSSTFVRIDGNGSIGALSDVDGTTAPVANDVLTYDGTSWQASAPVLRAWQGNSFQLQTLGPITIGDGTDTTTAFDFPPSHQISVGGQTARLVPGGTYKITVTGRPTAAFATSTTSVRGWYQFDVNLGGISASSTALTLQTGRAYVRVQSAQSATLLSHQEIITIPSDATISSDVSMTSTLYASNIFDGALSISFFTDDAILAIERLA